MSLLWQAVNHHPVVSDRDFKRFLRFPSSREFEGPLATNAQWAREWMATHARPWCVVAPTTEPVALPPAARVRPDDTLALIAVSAGVEPETEAAVRWAQDEPDRYFFLESLASAVVEALLAESRRQVGADAHYCPGYAGWSINENHRLLGLLPSPLPGPLSVLPSGMLCPRKSQLAVCFHRAPAPGGQ